MSLLDTASLVVTPNGTKASKLYSVVPSDGSGDLIVTRATTATRVNSSGLIESVASNVPRLDYTNGSCPSILVEPQRTNLLSYSEQFDNAYWLTSNASVTSNTANSPSGNATADTITSNSVSGGDIYVSLLTSGIHTFSAYFKAGSTSLCRLGSTVGGEATFNLSTQTFSLFNAISGSIKDVGNGWFRCTMTVNITATTLIYLGVADTTGKTVFAWGAQLEAGSYATSYIPTTSASVTRNADVISKTGISSLIGQTEGTLFVDFYHDGVANYNPCSISNGVYDDAVYFEMYLGNMYGVIWDSGAQQFVFNGGSLSVGRHKMAIAYKTNDVVFYIDGVLKTTDTSATIPTCARFDIGNVGGTSDSQKTQTNLSALWKTRLTNTQLAQLTTI